MAALHEFLLLASLILASSVYRARADATVTGTVFCDQCKDGGVSLFDYPLNGKKKKKKKNLIADHHIHCFLQSPGTNSYFMGSSHKFSLIYAANDKYEEP